ncbi:MAG: creatininase family protein [Vicinamibacterales bacterium]
MLKTVSLAAWLALLAVPHVVHAQAGSLFIEDLTWEEVAAALKAGKTTALVYTGGGEQNGPHLAFGKHNAVARHVVERIARELGNALIYPVLPYSPSGDPSKREGMMAFPGSSSLTDETYGMVVRDIALGAATAGFRDVILIGDHGGGQDVLKQTAATLDARLRPSGTRVFYCDDLYFKSRDEFSRYLHDHNVTGEGHAGVEDTSAILYVKPEWVRKDKIAAKDPAKGVEGDPRSGRAELGKVQLDLKVKVSVAQIRAHVASHDGK